MKEAFDSFSKRFGADVDAALQLLKVGESPRNSRLFPAELAGYTMVANLIMNLDETVVKQ